MAAARTQRASSLAVPTHRNAGGDAPSGRPAPPSADNDHHRCRQAEFRAAQCPRKQSSMVKKLTRTVLSAADVGVPVLLLSLLAASVHAFTAPVAGDLGYDIYDIVVNQGVKGPLGFVGGVAAFLFGVSRLFITIMLGIPPIVPSVRPLNDDNTQHPK